MSEAKRFRLCRKLVAVLLLLLAACAGPAAPAAPVTPPTLAPSPTPVPPSRVPTATAVPAPSSTPVPPSPLPTATAVPAPSPTPPDAVVFPPGAVVPTGWPALPADLYFLRAGRLWRWPAGGEGLEDLAAALEGERVQDYTLSPDGRYLLAQMSGDALYVLEVDGGAQVFPPAGAPPVEAPSHLVLPGSRHLLYLTNAGELYVVYRDAGGNAALLGAADGSALWDVRLALAGATSFRWGR